MNTTTVNTEGIDRLIGRVCALESIDFMPLMEEWRTILEEDNEANLGIDGYGVPLAAVTYRPDPNVGTRKPIKRDIIPPYNNLHSSHYRSLDGPPLSPRGPGLADHAQLRHQGRGPHARRLVARAGLLGGLPLRGRPGDPAVPRGRPSS